MLDCYHDSIVTMFGLRPFLCLWCKIMP